MQTAPWRLKMLVMMLKATSLMAICSGFKSRVPLAAFGFLPVWLDSTSVCRSANRGPNCFSKGSKDCCTACKNHPPVVQGARQERGKIICHHMKRQYCHRVAHGGHTANSCLIISPAMYTFGDDLSLQHNRCYVNQIKHFEVRITPTSKLIRNNKMFFNTETSVWQ